MLLIVAFFVGDRVARSYADQKVADTVATSAEAKGIRLGQKPTVDITGFPFLTQVAAGEYDKVLVHMRDVHADAYSISKLDVTAYGVHAKASELMNGGARITADTLDGTATLDYGWLSGQVKDQIGSSDTVRALTLSGSDGQLKVNATVALLGQQIKLTGTATVSVADGKVKVRVKTLKPAGTSLPSYAQQLLNELASQMSTDVALPNLPYDLKLSSVRPESDGLHVTATASNVALTS